MDPVDRRGGCGGGRAGVFGGYRGPHLPPRAYVAAGSLYLAVVAVLGLGTAFGQRWGAAYVFVAIAGWLGQTVNCHLMHIGTRFLATLARGDDDETPPWQLRTPALSWAALGLYQAAVLTGAAWALGAAAPRAALAGSAGLAGWLVFSLNDWSAFHKALET